MRLTKFGPGLTPSSRATAERLSAVILEATQAAAVSLVSGPLAPAALAALMTRSLCCRVGATGG